MNFVSYKKLCGIPVRQPITNYLLPLTGQALIIYCHTTKHQISQTNNVKTYESIKTILLLLAFPCIDQKTNSQCNNGIIVQCLTKLRMHIM